MDKMFKCLCDHCGEELGMQEAVWIAGRNDLIVLHIDCVEDFKSNSGFIGLTIPRPWKPEIESHVEEWNKLSVAQQNMVMKRKSMEVGDNDLEANDDG